MKKSVRPIFSIVLLIMAAATLTFRIMVSGGGGPFSINYSPVEPPVFNSTLLKLAAIDLSESSLRQDVEQLVEGHFRTGQGRQRSFLSSGKYRIDVRARSARGDPVRLRSPEFYRLWLEFRRHLQNWSRARKFQPEIMSQLADLGKGSVDRNDGVLRSGRKYRTCAVVGNSGILLNSALGEQIDSHEFVIRLNNARTTSYERNVGSKTSLSFINSNILHLCARREGCFCHPYGEKVPIIMYMCQPVHFLDYMVCNSSHKAPLIITDPRFDVLCSRIVKYYSIQRFLKETGNSVDEWASAHDGANFHYSSGMQAVMLAVGICDRVSIFGFGKSESAKHHYHTNQKGELQLHDYLAEYDLYNDLVKRPQVIPFISDKFKFPPVVMHK